MFDVSTSKGYDAGKLNFIPRSENTFEFIGRTRVNYGVQGYVKHLNTAPNSKNTISISQVGSVHAQLRKNMWYSSQNIFVLTPKIYEELLNLIVVTAINKVLTNYGGYYYPTLEAIKELIIQLPIKNRNIDFDFMSSLISELEEERISELEEERISELDAYLTVSKLDNYELSSDDFDVLDQFSKLNWKEYSLVNEVFNVKNTKNILSRDIIENSGTTPYLCASAENNSVSTYINYNNILKEKGNCIFIGGKTFVVTYQANDFFSNDSHNLALYLKCEENKSLENHLFLISSIVKGLHHKYSWGDSVSKTKIQNDTIMLPLSQDSEIDFEYMTKLINVVKKIVIKDVVRYADNKIETTKKVINN